jgi:hypothetical protein
MPVADRMADLVTAATRRAVAPLPSKFDPLVDRFAMAEFLLEDLPA